MIYIDTIGERLKKIRTLKGLTQVAVSDKAKINAALYRQYECGDRIPKVPQIKKIADALEVDIAFLQPSKTDSPMAILALIFDLIEEYGDVIFKQHGGTITFGIDNMLNKHVNLPLGAALRAHDKMPIDEFKKWLIDFPSTIENGEIIKKQNWR